MKIAERKKDKSKLQGIGLRPQAALASGSALIAAVLNSSMSYARSSARHKSILKPWCRSLPIRGLPTRGRCSSPTEAAPPMCRFQLKPIADDWARATRSPICSPCPAWRIWISPATPPGAGPDGRSLLMYLVDTNLVSELRRVRSGKADPGVAPGPTKWRPAACSWPPSPSTNWSWVCCWPKDGTQPRDLCCASGWRHWRRACLISRPWPQSQTSSHQMNGGRTCATSLNWERNTDLWPHP